MMKKCDLDMISDKQNSCTQTIANACYNALVAQKPHDKIMRTRKAARDWRLGRLGHHFDVEMPDIPGRPETPLLIPANKMPRRKKAGSLKMQIAMLHALAHIEFVAIDLALDMRLKQLGSHYGALPAHDGLWEAAYDTRHDAAARLAIVPMVLEARGLDVTPSMVERFSVQGDSATAKILTRIYQDEIRHVGAGTKWFESRAKTLNHKAETYWHSLVKKHFKGALKAPFNDSARQDAGLSREYYIPLALN